MRRLAEINERMGVGLILVEQNVPATLKVVEQTLILRSGRIAFQGSAAELSGNADLWNGFESARASNDRKMNSRMDADVDVLVIGAGACGSPPRSRA